MGSFVDAALSGLIYPVSTIMVLWTAGAMFYDVARASFVGWVMSIGWILAAALAFLFWQPPQVPFVVLLGVFSAFLFWWFRQRPSHERAWDPNFARLPRIELDGDTLRIHNLRNTEYPAFNKMMPRFETRTVRLSRLCGLDLLILHWGSQWMSHPIFVFDFGADGRVCVSIEVRYRLGQEYGFLRTLYRQQEFMYVVSYERDAILQRTRYRKGEDLYLYRWSASPIDMRHILFEYIHSINQIAAQPRWYNGLTSNCTTTIYAQGRARIDWDWRILFNGSLDRLMYERGRLDQSLPFDSLKQQSRLNEIANSAPADGFGDHIRRALSGYRLSAEGAKVEP
jgi:hypothetical protein